MVYLIISLLGILLTIFFVIGTHEFAHFITARAFGVGVIRFSLGFGKVLYQFRDKKNTEYVISLIPLGGYVKMIDEGEGPVAKKDLPYAFNRQPFYKKFLIVLAGPAMNIFCALVLYWIIFMIGFQTVKPIIGEVKPRSIAAESNLKPQQEIVGIDNNDTKTWPSVLFRLLVHAGDKDHMKMTVIDPTSKNKETHVLDLSNWHLSGLTPDPLGSLGITPYQPEIPLVVGVITANSPASSSDLRIGDKIIAINQKPIKDWKELMDTIMQYPGKTLDFTVQRDNQTLTFPVTLGTKHDILWTKYGFLGIAPHFEWPPAVLQKIQYGPLAALTHAWREITDFTYFNLLLFGKLITGKLSLQSLGGPITIFQTAGEALNYSLLSFLSFLAFLSISIGIINLLPVPGLDGGHLVFQIIEFTIRRPIPIEMLNVLYRIGFLFILLILVLALTNDLLRL